MNSAVLWNERQRGKLCVFAGTGARSLQWCESIQRFVTSPRRCSRSWWGCPFRNTANELVQCHAASSCPCELRFFFFPSLPYPGVPFNCKRAVHLFSTCSQCTE